MPSPTSDPYADIDDMYRDGTPIVNDGVPPVDEDDYPGDLVLPDEEEQEAAPGTSLRSFEPEDHDKLMQDHAEIGERYAPFYALHGGNNHAERKLKTFIAARKTKIRNSGRTPKLTEAAIEDEAYAEPDVLAEILRIETERLQFQLIALELYRCSQEIYYHNEMVRRGI